MDNLITARLSTVLHNATYGSTLQRAYSGISDPVRAKQNSVQVKMIRYRVNMTKNTAMMSDARTVRCSKDTRKQMGGDEPSDAFGKDDPIGGTQELDAFLHRPANILSQMPHTKQKSMPVLVRQGG
jgi:hypothetical protein